MTEERKVQLGVTVDATEAKAGFNEVKQDARDMAQAVGQAGQVAGKGMDAIGEGAKRAADTLTSEEGRMRAAVQRSTAASAQAASQSAMTWAQFQKANMGAAMKDAMSGGASMAEAHGSAMRKLGEDWRAYKEAVKSAGAAAANSAAGVVQATSAAAAASDKLAPALQRAGRGIEGIGAGAPAAAQKIDRATASMIASIQRTTALMDAGGRTSAKYYEALAAQRGVSVDALKPYLAQLEAVNAKQGAAVGALGATTKAFSGTSKTARELQFALRGVPAQFTDIAVSLSSGQRPMMVLLQQGGQLKDMFGGIGPAARALGGYIAGMVNPFTVAAAAVAGLAFAMARAESAARGLNSLQAQLAGTGRSNLFSTDELKDFLKELQLAPGVSREVATSIVSELSKARDIGGGLFKDLGKLAADYAKATGTDIPTAAKALAKAFEDPAKGIKQLDESLNGRFSSGLILTIERLSKAGDLAGAQRAQFAALFALVNGTADNFSTPLQRSFNDLGNSWEGAMRKMDQSDGLRNLNALLGEAVKLVTFLVNNADKVGGLGNIGVAMIPGIGAPAAIANAVTAPFRSAPTEKQTGGATGSFGPPVTGAGAAAAAAGGGDAEIKRALEAAKAYRGQAGELADLGNERKRFNAALTESIALYGKESEQATRLRAAIAGVDEKMAQVRKRGQGGGNEAQQVLDAQLQQSLKASKDSLQQERDNLAFSNRFLQGVFQAGAISLKDFYEEKRKAIAAGTAAELAELEIERVKVQAHLDATKKTSPKDASKLVADQTRLQEIDAQSAKLRTEGARAQVLANQEAGASFKALDEQVLQYQASLKSLQGDEIGAARIRDEIARRQLAVLANQSAGSSHPITQQDQAAFAAAQRQVSALNDAKTKTSAINQRLAIEEERIALLQRTGAIGEIEALTREGDARARALAQLEQQLAVVEKAASERPQDLQLKIDVEGFRLQVEQLKSALDPLKDKFDDLFKDAGANFFTDLMDQKGLTGALKAFANTVGGELNKLAGRELSQQLFGTGGILGGSGGLLARLVGGKDRTATLANTAQESFRGAELLAQKGADAAAAAGNSAAAASTAALSAAETAASAAISAASTSSAAALASMTAAAQAAAAALSLVAASRGAGAAGGLGGLLGGGTFTGTTGLEGLSPDILALAGLARGGYTGDIDPDKPAGVVHGKEYVFSAPAVAAIGVDRLERLHRKAKSGHMDEETPGYSDGGYVAVLGSVHPQGWRRSEGAAASNVYYTTNVNVTAGPNVTREQAMNQGRDIQRGMQIQAARRARNS